MYANVFTLNILVIICILCYSEDVVEKRAAVELNRKPFVGIKYASVVGERSADPEITVAEVVTTLPRSAGVRVWRWVGILRVEGIWVFCDVTGRGLGSGTHGVCSLTFMGVKCTNSSAQSEWCKLRTTVFGRRFMCIRDECGGTFY